MFYSNKKHKMSVVNTNYVYSTTHRYKAHDTTFKAKCSLAKSRRYAVKSKKKVFYSTNIYL